MDTLLGILHDEFRIKSISISSNLMGSILPLLYLSPKTDGFHKSPLKFDGFPGTHGTRVNESPEST